MSEINPLDQTSFTPITIDVANAIVAKNQGITDSISASKEVIAAYLATIDATKPRIPLSDYLFTISDAKLLAKLQTILDAFGSLEATKAFLNAFNPTLDFTPLTESGGLYDDALDTLRNTDNFEAKKIALDNAIAAYQLNPSASTGADLEAAAADYNAAILSSAAANTEALNDLRNSYGLPSLPFPPTYNFTYSVGAPAPNLDYSIPTREELITLVNDLKSIVSILLLRRQFVDTGIEIDPDNIYDPRTSMNAAPGIQGSSTLGSVGAGDKGQKLNEAFNFKKILDSFFNAYGAPLASMHVDQLASTISAFLDAVQISAGLTGAGPGSAVLNNGSLSQAGGTQAAFIVAAFGNLQKISQLIADPSFAERIKSLLLQNLGFRKLTPDFQNKILKDLTNILALMLLQNAFAQFAVAIRAPGLVGQGISKSDNVTDEPPSEESLEANQAFIFSLLEDELELKNEQAKAFAKAIADEIAARTITNNQQILQSIADKTAATTAQQAAIQEQLNKANLFTSTEQQALQEIEQDILKTILLREINRYEYGPILIGTVPITKGELISFLEGQGITAADAVAISGLAIAAAFPFNTANNPLAIGSAEDLKQEEIKSVVRNLITHQLSPFVKKEFMDRILTEYEKEQIILRIKLGEASGLPIFRELVERAERRRHDDWISRVEDRRQDERIQERIEDLKDPSRNRGPIHLGYTLLLLGHGVASAERGLDVGRFSGIQPKNSLTG